MRSTSWLMSQLMGIVVLCGPWLTGCGPPSNSSSTAADVPEAGQSLVAPFTAIVEYASGESLRLEGLITAMPPDILIWEVQRPLDRLAGIVWYGGRTIGLGVNPGEESCTYDFDPHLHWNEVGLLAFGFIEGSRDYVVVEENPKQVVYEPTFMANIERITVNTNDLGNANIVTIENRDGSKETYAFSFPSIYENRFDFAAYLDQLELVPCL